MQKESRLSFAGKFNIVDSLDFGDQNLPPQYEAKIGESDNEKYLVAEENGKILGFVVLDLPEDKSIAATLGFRFVFPEHNGKKIGKKLSDEAIKYCKENGYQRITAGINDVLIIGQDGQLIPNLDTKSEGTWRSYAAKTESSLPFNIQHKVKFVTLDKNGKLSLAIDTLLDTDEEVLLPDTPEGLLAFLRDQGVLPQDLNNLELLDEVGNDYFAVFRNGSKISFAEYFSLLNLTK